MSKFNFYLRKLVLQLYFLKKLKIQTNLYFRKVTFTNYLNEYSNSK